MAVDASSLALAASVERLGTETAFSVLARARELEREGRDIIHLEIGAPDFETPSHVSEAAYAAIKAGHTHYCQTAGLPELREAAAAHLAETRVVPIEPDSVLVATGAKPFLFFTVLATCEPGDEVVYPDPGFPIYESAVRWSGATPVPLPLREDQGFGFDPDELARLITPRTKLVFINSPQNPTGGVLHDDVLAAAAETLADSRAWVLSDEVYSRITFGRSPRSIATFPGMAERTILVDGFSKTYSMTGWRVGYASVPDALNEPLVRFIVNSTSCVPPFAQLAGVAALEGPQDQPDAMVREFRARRDMLVPALNELPGVSCVEPEGAFYVFPNVSELPLSAEDFAARLLDEAGVAVVAGTAFGSHATDNIRLSYASSMESLERAVERMGDFLATLD